MKPNITLIGAGNVATHLGKRLHETGHTIVQVFSRKADKAARLASQVRATATDDLRAITTEADLYILAVHDDAIRQVAKQLVFLDAPERVFVHTSGATPSTVLENTFQQYGVLYPLQSFSIDKKVDFTEVPVCVYANTAYAQTIIRTVAEVLSSKVYAIDDYQRSVLHVAAVFVNNFSNYLFQVGEDICQQEGVSFDILRPLILETARKVQQAPPAEMQTGPARRGDTHTIEKHLQFLEKHPLYQGLYLQLTRQIQKVSRRDAR